MIAHHSRQGDAQYYADCKYRAGVVSIQEFAAWPVWDLELLEAQSRLGKFRIESLLGRGVVLHEDFCGKMGVSTLLRMYSIAMDSLRWKVPSSDEFLTMW